MQQKPRNISPKKNKNYFYTGEKEILDEKIYKLNNQYKPNFKPIGVENDD